MRCLFPKFVFTTITLILMSFFNSGSLSASSYSPAAKAKLVKDLSAMTTNDLVWMRAFNNTQHLWCQSHQTNAKYLHFYNIASDVIASELIDRGDWDSFSWSTKYGFRKGQLKALKKRIGLNGYCQCIYDHIVYGKSGCLNP